MNLNGGRVKYLFVTILIGLLGLSGCGDADDATRLNTFSSLTAIEITAENTQIANLTSTQLKASGNFSGLFSRDITADVVWESSDQTVATLSNDAETRGRVAGIFPGTTSITATVDGITDSFSLTVSNATISSLAISPLTTTIPKGLTAQFQATGNFSDATSQDITFDVDWSSSDPLAASVSNAVGSKGLASALAVGTSDISASFEGIDTSTLMTVSAARLDSLSISPADPSLLSLSSRQFTATGSFSDASTLDITNQVTWASKFPTFASVSNSAGSQGLVATLLNGVTTISARLDGVNAATGLSVTGGNLATIQVLPAKSSFIHIDPVIPLQMSAEGTFDNGARDISDQVTWSSTVPAVATISPQGIVTTVGAGETEIQAVNGTVPATTKLTVVAATFNSGTLVVRPASAELPTLAKGTSLKFTASGQFGDGSSRDLTSVVTWSSSAAGIAEIGNSGLGKGVVSGLAAGTTNINADFRGLDSDSANLDVTAPSLVALSIDNPSPSLLPGASLQFTATATYGDATTQNVSADVVWSSVDSSVAIFDAFQSANGEILAVDTGSVEIMASLGEETDTLTVEVP